MKKTKWRRNQKEKDDEEEADVEAAEMSKTIPILHI